MLIQPCDLPDATVADVVTSAWGVSVQLIEYAPVGFGSHHWRVADGAKEWFVTVDVASFMGGPAAREAASRLGDALSGARQLHDLGLVFVVAPIATTDGRVLALIDDKYVAALYPYIEGETFGWGPFPGAPLRNAMLGRLLDLHATSLGDVKGLRVDEFALPVRDRLEAVLVDGGTAVDAGPFSLLTRQLLVRHADGIGRALMDYDRMVEAVSARRDRFVVTHGEPHPANLIDAEDDGLVLVDWDTALLAPPERDLWKLFGEDPALLDEYQRNANIEVDRRALDLYRLRWDLADLALYVAQLQDPHEDHAETRVAHDCVTEIVGRLT